MGGVSNSSQVIDGDWDEGVFTGVAIVSICFADDVVLPWYTRTPVGTPQ